MDSKGSVSKTIGKRINTLDRFDFDMIDFDTGEGEY
jgi:hypothetical protein